MVAEEELRLKEGMDLSAVRGEHRQKKLDIVAEENFSSKDSEKMGRKSEMGLFTGDGVTQPPEARSDQETLKRKRWISM